MTTPHPPSLTSDELRARGDRVARIAERLHFIGRVEYQQVYSQTGGAQYGMVRTVEEDLLSVYTEAFDRDADPSEYSLEAIIAHERGHQLLIRHPRIAKSVKGRISLASEEVLASLLGAMICSTENDREDLLAKATYDMVIRGATVEASTRQLKILRELLGRLL
jgi:hypothetical protein